MDSQIVTNLVKTFQAHAGQIVGGLASGIGAIFTAQQVYAAKKVSGAATMQGNSATIGRMTNAAAAVQDAMDKNEKIGSIVFANMDGALVARRDGEAVDKVFFALNDPAQIALFGRAKEHLDEAGAMIDMARHPDLYRFHDVAECASAKKESRNWTRQREGTIFKAINEKFDDNAKDTTDKLLDAVQKLSADKSTDLNLSNHCHVQAKWTDEKGLSHVVVMPTNKAERQVIVDMMSGVRANDAYGYTGHGVVTTLAEARRKQFWPEPGVAQPLPEFRPL